MAWLLTFRAIAQTVHFPWQVADARPVEKEGMTTRSAVAGATVFPRYSHWGDE
jgi:hypothetical protein